MPFGMVILGESLLLQIVATIKDKYLYIFSHRFSILLESIKIIKEITDAYQIHINFRKRVITDVCK